MNIIDFIVMNKKSLGVEIKEGNGFNLKHLLNKLTMYLFSYRKVENIAINVDWCKGNLRALVVVLENQCIANNIMLQSL